MMLSINQFFMLKKVAVLALERALLATVGSPVFDYRPYMMYVLEVDDRSLLWRGIINAGEMEE